MKKFLIGLLIVVIVIVIAVMIALRLTSNIIDVANGFFGAVAKNDYAGAYAMLSKEFQRTTSLEQFQAYLSGTGLSDFASSSWSNRSISGGRGEVEGSITTNKGGTVPLKITFVKEEGAWRILSIEGPKVGLVTEGKGIPEDPVLERMVKASMLDLARAINSRDFGGFYSTISKLWQAQTSKGELANIFKSFCDQNIDLTVLQQFEPVFDEKPHLDENEFLILQGYFPTQPLVTRFTLKYLYEHPDWKLAGVNVEVK